MNDKFNFNRKTNDSRLQRDIKNGQLVSHNKLDREFVPTDEEAMEYTKDATNRQQALALLAKLKAKEAEGMGATKIFWVDQQPTLVECSSKLYWEGQLKKRGFDGRPESPGTPATDSNPRKPSSWEVKRDSKNRRQYTLAETPTMQFKSSGHLPAEYYQDEEQLEAYIDSLSNDNE